MHVATLRTICRAAGLNQSDLARLAGLTRQAVSAWFRAGAADAEGNANVKSRHLHALSKRLGVPVRVLLEPLPGLDPEQHERWRARLLWDRLYPDLGAFLLALVAGEDRALARLVDQVGLYRAAKIAGEIVWRRFPDYRRHLHPARRAGLEQVWTVRQRLTSR